MVAPAFRPGDLASRAWLAIATSLAMLTGCAASQTQTVYPCLLPSEQRMLVAELFFGRGLEDRQSLADTEWAEFAAQSITPNFPDGFTVFDGEGQWRNPQTKEIVRDRTKILLVATKPESDLVQRLLAVIDDYKARFHQQSVGIITRDSCATF